MVRCVCSLEPVRFDLFDLLRSLVVDQTHYCDQRDER